MQAKIIVALFCTIIIALIGLNDGAPIVSKPEPVKDESSNTKIIKPVAGGRSAWKTSIDAKSKAIFNSHKKTVLKKIQTVHKLKEKFDPKPSKVSTQLVAGILYHYLVKLPTNKYAHVTILHRSWVKDKLTHEDNVTVRPELYDLNSKDI